MQTSVYSQIFVFRRFASFVCFALVLCSALIGKAEHLPIQTYTVADGLLRDNVYKIKQDSRGFLWFCTPEGISRFDGYAFTNFTTADGLPDRHVNDFLETENGTIYIATDKGLARLNPTGIRAPFESDQSTKNPKSKIQNSLFSVYMPDNERAGEVHVLFEDESGAVWAGTSDGLYKLSETSGDAKLESVNLGEPSESADGLFSVNAIVKDRRGAMWVGTSASGLFRLSENGETQRFSIADGLPQANIVSLYQTRDGGFWVSFRGDKEIGLCLLDAETSGSLVKKCYSLKDGLPSDWITDLYQTSDGQFWLGTTRGLCRWQDDGQSSVCKTYTAKNDLCDYDVWSVLEDKDGNLWTGSRCGAKKMARYGFTNYSVADGLGGSGINSIFENQSGDLFVSAIGSDKRIVSRFDGEKFSAVNPSLPSNVNYTGWGWKQTVWQDRAGAWWIPTGFGLFRSPDATSFENLARADLRRVAIKMKGSEIFRLFEDSRGDIWIATTGATNEIFRWERAKNIWHNYTPELGFSPTRIGSAFAEDGSGAIWIGTGEADSALIKYRDGQFKIFTRGDGIPAGWIRDLFFDRAGNLWIANTENGLLKVADTNAEKLSFIRYTPAEGLSSIGVLCATEDDFGRIYAGTGRGLDRLNPTSGQIENFTTFDGLPNSYVEICYRDRAGVLWFGTGNGLARFQPEPEKQRRPPTILITGLRVAGVPQSVSILGASEIPNVELNSDQKQISIDFLGLGATLGEKLKYEYRLSGEDWTSTIERTVNFANLAAGAYHFEVRARNADRIYSQIPATFAFRIAAPVWQRWWFALGILLLTTLAIYLFYKNRLHRLLEMERMRTRIATDLHDDIGANLTRISLLSEVAKQKSENGKPSNLLTSIAEIARESVASMNDIVWAIAPEHDSLLDLTRRMRQHAEEVLALRDIDLNFNASDADLKLSVGVRRDVLLIFKEAVNNAARHSRCSKVEIDFRVEHSVLNLRIADNGRGFETDSESDGQGLRSMTRRAHSLGGELKIDSQAGNGTKVEFDLPLPKARSESRL
ncbi:MAG: two-component regulator propeller domain-containing protein [Pyrinomonadaceae bacterium]